MSLILFTILTLTTFHTTIAGLSCPEDWVDCGNGKCIAFFWRCDGDNDCGNLKDEENCESGIPPKACLSSQFQCHEDGHCITQAWHCDGERDCEDGSDELNCANDTNCNGFRCRDNHCIPSNWKCDGRRDCPDGSDENSCPKAAVCLENEFTCASGTCLDRSKVCDSKKDCSDASDEGKHCADLCSNATCSQKCRQTPRGPQCYCEDGYRLSTKDSKTCNDIDECLEEGFCSQECTNVVGSYKCSCMEGYELVNRTCKATGPEPLLVFSSVHEIRAIYLRTKRYFPIHKAVFKAASLDADPLESRIYWIEISNKSTVYSSKVDGTGFGVVLNSGLLVPEDIAVDYVARNLYFTDSGLRQVLACKMDGSMCHVLHNTDIDKPRAITLDPPEGLLYWSDWGDNASGIYRSGMDGSRRITLVGKDIRWPNGIAIDHTTNRLYWTDASMQTIEYITLDGQTRKAILKDEVFHPYSLAVFEDNLFWSDWNTFSLETCNKFTSHKMNIMTRENGKHIMGVHVYHPVLARKANNPCWSNGCSHMCLIAPLGGYSCGCPPGYNLASNKRTCLIDDKFPMLLVNDESSIYHIRPEAVGSTAVSELPVNRVDSIGRLAYDWKSKMLFITDVKAPAIYALNMTNFIQRELVKNHLVTPEDIAYDPVGRNLYWVDSSKGTVEVVSSVTSKVSIIVVDLSKPVAIALVVKTGKMFVSSVGEDSCVTMYDMDGQNGRILTAISSLAVALAVHPSSSLLYWADPKAETVSYLDYSNPRSEPSIVKSSVGTVMSVAVNEKYVYWTDSRHHVLSLIKHNATHSHTITLPGLKTGLVSRKVIYTALPVSSRKALGGDCVSNNGGCSHLCLTSPSGRTCVCAAGMVLSKDNVSCTEKECLPDEYTCPGSRKCVPREFVCDGIKDCEDASDEICDNKPLSRCPGNDFRCVNGRCILASWKCDRRDDCGDNSDEIGCPAPSSCSKDQFTCGNGECIPSLWRCDGESDCSDDHDEKECHLTACSMDSQFRCDHGQCIPMSWVCDGAADCHDSTDEKNCTVAKNCNSKQFQCGDGICIDLTLVCDQRIDCEDGSDERNCTKEKTCPLGKRPCSDDICIYSHEICDGYKDCTDGGDEFNCTRTAAQCSAEEYYCTNSSRCISRRWICDGDDDCGDEADENPENCTRQVKATLPPYKLIIECEEFVCSFSGECISWSKVCNGENDCNDLTDEGPLCQKACEGKNGGCSQKCQKTPQGTKCSCFNGYELSYDGMTCEDFDECTIAGSCSQYCNNTKGGFKCSCADGYFLENDHRKCKADGGAATLVYLLPDEIRGIDLGTRSQRVYIKQRQSDKRGMDYDATEGIFFWSDWKESTINSYTPNSNRQDVLVHTRLRPHYIRWDWVAMNFYYCDDEGNIVACTKNGAYCATIVHNAAPHLNGFDIAPTHGLIFWSVWEVVLSKAGGVIERSDMDGSRRLVIVSDNIIWPSGVTVDHIIKTIYWTDVKLNVMESVDFHGLRRRTVVANGLYYPFSMTIFEDHVYWSDWGSDTIFRCDKFGGENCIPIHRGNAKAEVVMVVHKVKQPKGRNHCARNPCQQICLPTRTSFTCKCDDDYVNENYTCGLIPTAAPAYKPKVSCPPNYCQNAGNCIVVAGKLGCQCPYPFKGDVCEKQVPGTEPVYDYSWVVGVVLATLFILLIIVITLVCRQNKEKLTKYGESVAVSFRSVGLARKTGHLVVDTDDGAACDEVMLGESGSFKQSSFGNPLFGKKPTLLAEPEPHHQDGEFKRWPSYDSGDSAFVSESQTREGSQFCIDQVPLSGPALNKLSTDRIVQFFRR